MEGQHDNDDRPDRRHRYAQSHDRAAQTLSQPRPLHPRKAQPQGRADEPLRARDKARRHLSVDHPVAWAMALRMSGPATTPRAGKGDARPTGQAAMPRRGGGHRSPSGAGRAPAHPPTADRSAVPDRKRRRQYNDHKDDAQKLPRKLMRRSPPCASPSAMFSIRPPGEPENQAVVGSSPMPRRNHR